MAEGLGSKNYRWDKKDNYWVPNDGRNLYNSYFYDAHNSKTSLLEKFKLHGRETSAFLDGGVAVHANLEDHLTEEQYLKVIDYAIECGTNYFTFNIPNSKCCNCGHITKHPITECPKCESTDIEYYTRIIGYLKATKYFGADRKKEEERRHYGKPEVC